MERYADRLKPFLEYPFAEIDRAKAEAQKRMRVVDFGVGDPDIPTDKHIQGALVAALSEASAHKYPGYSGESDFRKSAVRYFLNRWHVKLDPESEILALIGSKEGIAHLPLAVLNPDETACYPDPAYPVYKAGIVFAGGKAVPIKLRPELGFLPDLGDIPSDTKLLWLNYPNNPTGQDAPEEFWRDAIIKAREMRFILVNDAAYAELYYDRRPTGPIAQGGKDVAVEIHSLSKPYSMCGWRVAFVAGNSDVIAALGALKKNIDSGVFRPIQKAAITAMDDYANLIPPVVKIYKRRVDRLRQGLLDLGWKLFPTPATFYVWAKIPEGTTSAEFAKKLIEEAGVVVLPGSAMGKGGEGFVRFSLTLTDEDIELGIERLSRITI